MLMLPEILPQVFVIICVHNFGFLIDPRKQNFIIRYPFGSLAVLRNLCDKARREVRLLIAKYILETIDAVFRRIFLKFMKFVEKK